MPITALILTAMVALTGCSISVTADSTAAAASASASASASSWAASRLPSPAVLDYQLGGAYTPAANVTVVARDRSDPPAPGVYSICYVNGFQTQPGEAGEWDPDLLLRDADGEAIADPNWPDEYLLNIATADARARIADRVSEWIRGCAVDGFAAVEFDNLDTFTRSDERLTQDNAVALATMLIAAAHDAGLSAAQKNSAEQSGPLKAAGFDFVVAEECAQFGECAIYSDVYGDAVLDIEYIDAQEVSFAEFCADPQRPSGIVLRDRKLAPAGSADHVAQWCT